MSVASFKHQTAEVNGIRVHYVRQRPAQGGVKMTLVLLHGWPEFWYAWHKNIPVLSQQFDVIVPDLRGFGDTDTPPGIPSLDDYVADLAGLLDHLGVERAGIVSHDVGAHVAQTFVLAHPHRVTGLFFGNCPYPGIGRRWIEDQHANQIWYQSFHLLPLAVELVGASRDSCRAYFKHFLDHWSARPGRFDDDLEVWVDNFMKPGNLEGGFNWYKAGNEARLKQISEGPQPRAMIELPARFLWGKYDAVLSNQWIDGLEDYFSNAIIETCEDAGHFVFYEQPERANEAVMSFFLHLAEADGRA